MDIFAHALWAGAALGLAHRRWPIKPAAAAATVVLAALPDVAHTPPVLMWSLSADGTFAALVAYATALPGQEPPMAAIVALASHHLHCILHSAVVAGVVTLGMWALAGARYGYRC